MVADAAGLFLVIAVSGAAFVARSMIVVATRRRWPSVAAAIERWWAWVPLVALCALTTWSMPLIGIPVTIGMAIALTRPGALGSPFRPRG